MIVLDASALTDMLAPTPKGASVARRLADADLVCAPELVIVEVTSALWRLVRAGALSRSGADTAVTRLESIPLRLMPHHGLLRLAWSFKESARIADSYYLACAQMLGLPLVTTDGRLARSPHPGITVIVVG